MSKCSYLSYATTIYKQKIAAGSKRQIAYHSWFAASRYAPRNSLCVLTKKKVSEVEHTPIPVVPGSNMAIGQSLSMVVLQRSCGTRRRPRKTTRNYISGKNKFISLYKLNPSANEVRVISYKFAIR